MVRCKIYGGDCVHDKHECDIEEVDDPIDQTYDCPDCGGLGQFDDSTPCRTCDGEGEIDS